MAQTMPTRTLPAWDHPVLTSVEAVVGDSRWVTTDPDAVEAVARWMAWEDLPSAVPEVMAPEARDTAIDHAMVTTAIDFAFTDFDTGVPFTAEHDGATLVDAEAMFLRIDTAIAEGVPFLDGAWLATVTPAQLEAIFHGPSPMPLLPERAAVLNAIGEVLVDRWEGRFHRFVASCPPRVHHAGEGLLERLVEEFPTFDDSATLRGAPVHLHKLAQLALWTVHRTGARPLEDVDTMSAFADYILPAALRAMGVLTYHPDLAEAVDSGREVPRDSEQEVELRVHTVHATALLTEAINRIRPPALAITIPQLDYRLWGAFHAHIRPHHLTRTDRY